MVLARDYDRATPLPPARQRVLYPLAAIVAPVAHAVGYRGRFKRYSRPQTPA